MFFAEDFEYFEDFFELITQSFQVDFMLHLKELHQSDVLNIVNNTTSFFLTYKNWINPGRGP